MTSPNSASARSRLRRAASRLLPRSLFGRLILIFTGAFLTFLVIGALHAAETKRYYILRGLMRDRARRMADMSLLLDTAGEEGRAVLIGGMSTKGFSIPYRARSPGPARPDRACPQDGRRGHTRLARKPGRGVGHAGPSAGPGLGRHVCGSQCTADAPPERKGGP